MGVDCAKADTRPPFGRAWGGRVWLAMIVAPIAFVPLPVDGAQPCRPKVSLVEARAEPPGLTLRIATDARRCASASGDFEISLVRLKENAPDETFAESMSWSEGIRSHVLALTSDEVISDVWIRDVSPCGCRLTTASSAAR